VHHLPVGSALPDMRHLRAPSRLRLGIGDDEIAVATLGTGHASQLTAPVRLAVNAMATHGIPVVLLRLGAGAGALHGLDGRVRVHRPDRQPVEALAADLAAADLALLPISEGASTRRTSLVSVLQHGIPAVSTDAAHTGGTLRRADGGLLLAPLHRDEVFVEMALRLAMSGRDERARLGQNARRLYDEVFAWPAITARLLRGLESLR
jgi:glycosyltransferase involved in cell wall biosynthesis